MTTSPNDSASIRIGISQCLLWESVRYDGGHKHDRYLTETLGRYFEWVPVCPEVEIGMGVPREPIHLLQIGDDVRLVGTKSRDDHTLAMRRYAKRRIEELREQRICGYVLKKDSPSCGMERVRMHQENGEIRRSGRGLFAAVLLDEMPNLPVEEEGRLSDPKLRENWVERVFAYHRLQQLWDSRWTLGKLVEFHTAHKLVLMAHSPTAYQRLGQLVANGKKVARPALREEYETQFMAALAQIATPGRHANVLQHIIGYFREHLDDASRTELLGHIEDYRQGHVPLIVPITMVNHYVRVFGIEYLQKQKYLNPHPKELALRNYV